MTLNTAANILIFTGVNQGRSVSPAANKKRRPYGMTDAVRDIVRTSPVLSILAAFAAGMIIGFRPRRR